MDRLTDRINQQHDDIDTVNAALVIAVSWNVESKKKDKVEGLQKPSARTKALEAQGILFAADLQKVRLGNRTAIRKARSVYREFLEKHGQRVDFLKGSNEIGRHTVHNQPEETPKPAAASQEATESVDRVPDTFTGTTLEELHEWDAKRSMQADNDLMKKWHTLKPEDFGLR